MGHLGQTFPKGPSSTLSAPQTNTFPNLVQKVISTLHQSVPAAKELWELQFCVDPDISPVICSSSSPTCPYYLPISPSTHPAQSYGSVTVKNGVSKLTSAKYISAPSTPVIEGESKLYHSFTSSLFLWSRPTAVTFCVRLQRIRQLAPELILRLASGIKSFHRCCLAFPPPIL